GGLAARGAGLRRAAALGAREPRARDRGRDPLPGVGPWQRHGVALTARAAGSAPRGAAAAQDLAAAIPAHGGHQPPGRADSGARRRPDPGAAPHDARSTGRVLMRTLGQCLVGVAALALFGGSDALAASRSMEALRARLVRAGRAEVNVRQAVTVG